MTARRKGAQFERDVAAQLREIWPDAKRGLSQSRDGAECADIEGTPFWIELKADERRSIDRAVRQATAAHDHRPIVVITKRAREDWLVTMRFPDWFAHQLAIAAAAQALVDIRTERPVLSEEEQSLVAAHRAQAKPEFGRHGRVGFDP